MSRLERAASFIESHGRALERAQFAYAFADGSAADVHEALAPYRNADGGFGNALEPDVRTELSYPLAVHFAASALRKVGLKADASWSSICDHLASCATSDGALAYVPKEALESPHAAHWASPFGWEPSLHATAGVIAGLHALELKHPWLTQATEWCLNAIEAGPKWSGHTMQHTLDLLEHAPSSPRVEEAWENVTAQLFDNDYVYMDTPVVSYGVTPIQFAPSPDCRLAKYFENDVLERHIDDLERRQNEDGGWPISWEPPEGGEPEWRSILTLDSLLTLRAYGRTLH